MKSAITPWSPFPKLKRLLNTKMKGTFTYLNVAILYSDSFTTPLRQKYTCQRAV